MGVWDVANDWVALPLWKAFLKRNCSQILATDVDWEQLGVQLNKGSLELKDCLLDAKYLNEQLTSDLYEIESVLLGRISVNVFDPRIVLEDVVVIVKERSDDKIRPPHSHYSASHPGFGTSRPLYSDSKAQETAGSAVDEGVTIVSNLVQRKLKKLQVEGRGIVVQIKLAKGQLLTINLDTVGIKDAHGVENELKTACHVAKECSFSGLAVQVTSDGDSAAEVLASISYESTGCSGNVVVGWVAPEQLKSLTIEARASFNGACVWMSPAAVSVISNLVDKISTRAQQRESDANNIPGSHHPLSRSMLIVEAASSRNIVKALMLPDGEHLLKEELAHLPGAHHDAGEDMEEFFDALSYSVTDFMAQSFFSTASSAFAEASRPPSPYNEPSSPTQGIFGSGDDFPPSKSMDAIFQLELEVGALEFWLACRSELIGSPDPWYMRLNMQGLSLSQVHELSCTALTASIQSIDISEYTPIEANKSKLHDIGQFEALFESLAKHCDLPYIQRYFNEKTAFADTIRRLEHLKLADRNFWCPPDNYEMSPIVACTASGNPAFSLICERASPCALSARVLLLEVHSWLNAPMLARIEKLLSSFAAGFSSRTSDTQRQDELSLDFSLHLSSLALCFFAPNAAVAIQILSGVSIDELSSNFYKRGPRWNQAVCPPFFELHSKLQQNALKIHANRAQIHNIAIEDAPDSIDIVEGGYADALSISCMLDTSLDLQTLSANLPENIAILINRSTVKSSEINIAGHIQFNLTPISLRSVTEIARSFSAYSRPPNNSGVVKLHFDSLTVQFLGPLLLHCNGVEVLHFLDFGESAVTIGSIGTFDLGGAAQWPYISTSGCEERAIAFAIADCDSYRELSQPAVKNQAIFHMAGVILAEDFLCGKQFWSEFDYLEATAESPSDTTAQSFAVKVSGKDLLILQIPSNENQVALGVHVETFNLETFSGDVVTDIVGVSFYLREGGPANMGSPIPFAVPTWLQRQGFLLIAREEDIHLERKLSTISLSRSESILLRTRSLHISLSKDSAALIKLFAQLNTSHTSSEEAYENVSVMAADAIGEALGLDVRGPDELHASLHGAWYEDEGLGVEDIIGSLGPGEQRQCSFLTTEAVVGGDGAWLSSYIYIPDYVRNVEEVAARGRRNRDAIPARTFAITTGAITVIVVGTVSAQGEDILEGSVQVKLENSEAFLSLYHGANTSHCTYSLQRLSMRHDIHPQATSSSPWRDVIICPRLRGQTAAFSCQVELSKSQGGRAEMVIRANCSPVLVRLDQYLLLFAREFINTINLDPWQFIDELVEEDEEEPAESIAVSAYIQRCHIAGFALGISYVPAYVDMSALRQGRFVELLNVVPELKANLWLRELEICAAESFSSLGTVLATRWIQDIVAFQIHNLTIPVPGAPSVRIGAIGKTLSDFAALPATPSKKTLKQLQEAVLVILRLLAAEGREVGATVAEAWKNRP